MSPLMDLDGCLHRNKLHTPNSDPSKTSAWQPHHSCEHLHITTDVLLYHLATVTAAVQ